MGNDITELVASMLSGSERALSRLISLVEGDSSIVPRVREAVSPHVGKAYRVGITGPVGSGKSTLVDRLTAIMRGKGLTVGIVAVDPSSPITGGAVLGDRIRMQQHYLDEGVFIRSMASRGSYGGLSKAVSAAVDLLDAFGKDFILIETIGVGQVDVSITEVAQTVVLVLVPESGDSMQFMKAGIIEVADVIVANKADRGGCERIAAEIKGMSVLSPRKTEQSCIITQAANNIGVEELYQELEKRRNTYHSPNASGSSGAMSS